MKIEIYVEESKMLMYVGYMVCLLSTGWIFASGGDEMISSQALCRFADSAHVSMPGAGSISALDADDIQQSQKGDSDAYRRLIKRHEAHISKIMWRFSRDRNTHEELVQDVFVQAYMSLNSYKAKAPFEHWIARIATRIGYKHWKKTAKLKETEPFSLQDWDKTDDTTEAELKAAEAAEVVHKLLAILPDRDRLVLSLRYLDQCSVEETASRTGWTKTMVKVQTFRAKKKLQKLLEESDIEV
jgi:RNA polymerase sigma-70 factor (ECF subfamily)